MRFGTRNASDGEHDICFCVIVLIFLSTDLTDDTDLACAKLVPRRMDMRRRGVLASVATTEDLSS